MLTLTLKNKAMPKKTPKIMMSSSTSAKKAEYERQKQKDQKDTLEARVAGRKPKGTLTKQTTSVKTNKNGSTSTTYPQTKTPMGNGKVAVKQITKVTTPVKNKK